MLVNPQCVVVRFPGYTCTQLLFELNCLNYLIFFFFFLNKKKIKKKIKKKKKKKKKNYLKLIV